MTRATPRAPPSAGLDDHGHRASVQSSVLLEHDVRPEQGERQALVGTPPPLPARATFRSARARAEAKSDAATATRTPPPESAASFSANSAARAQRLRPGGGEHATALAARHRRVGRRDVGVQRRGRSGGDPRGARVAAARAGGATQPVRFVPLDVRVLDVDDDGARHLAWAPDRSSHRSARRRRRPRPAPSCFETRSARREARWAPRSRRKEPRRRRRGFGGVGVGVDVWLERHGAAAEHAGAAAALLVHLDSFPEKTTDGENLWTTDPLRKAPPSISTTQPREASTPPPRVAGDVF